jgi:hypothetical protein
VILNETSNGISHELNKTRHIKNMTPYIGLIQIFINFSKLHPQNLSTISDNMGFKVTPFVQNIMSVV